MIVYVTRRVRFSAAHSYENIPSNLLQNGRMVNSGRIHGHNYVVDLTCKGAVTQPTGMVVNITEIDAVLKGLLMPLDQSYLERDHPDTAWGIPTTENLARWVWHECDGKIPSVKLHTVKVLETDTLWSEYTGKANMAYLTRSYEFAAAHRLHCAELPEEENLRIFGKCNNPNGHGHNYGLEVTVSGDIDKLTGMCADIGQVDRIVTEQIVRRFDHKHLNLDVPEFFNLNPTSENIAVVIWRILKPYIGGALYKICVRETEKNYFEYYGEE